MLDPQGLMGGSVPSRRRCRSRCRGTSRGCPRWTAWAPVTSQTPQSPPARHLRDTGDRHSGLRDMGHFPALRTVPMGVSGGHTLPGLGGAQTYTPAQPGGALLQALVFFWGNTLSWGCLGGPCSRALGGLRQHPEPPDLVHPPTTARSSSWYRGALDTQTSAARDPQTVWGPPVPMRYRCWPGTPKTGQQPPKPARDLNTSQGPQHHLGTSSKAKGPLTLARTPTSAWGPQCQLAP